nr:integral inner nuclear membrane protein ima1 [Quercus suber]
MGLFRRRIYCHYCNQRTPYAKAAGIRQFQCDHCEAINTLDSKGEVDDTSPSLVRPISVPLTFTQPLPASLDHQKDSVFCRECQHNQLVYHQTLSNYLPDDDDPQYQNYEDALPQFKAELERRHPQICARCAPRAQHILNRADVYAATDNMSRITSATRRGKSITSKDNWSKRSKRGILDICGVMLYASLATQIGWHAYEMLAAKGPFRIYSTPLLYEFQARELSDLQKRCGLPDISRLRDDLHSMAFRSRLTARMGLFRRRIYCHYCNQRTPYAKAAGIRQFQCDHCEAINTLDSKGEVDDTSPSLVRPISVPLTFTQPLPASLDHQKDSVFCRECQHNQLVYHQTLSNYLPDDDDPQYQNYEDALPQFKAELERRHPQICARCAPRAQHILNRADVYAATDNMSRITSATRRGKSITSKDNWSKRSKRGILDICGVMLYASLATQIGWHAYEMLAAKGPFRIYSTPLLYEFQARELSDLQKRCGLPGLTFLSPHCHHECVSRALSISLLLLWHNPGLRYWYHPIHRIVAVTGQAQYYVLQVILLVIRIGIFYYLSTWTYARYLSASRRLAFHGFSIAVLLIVQTLSHLAIEPVVWKLNMKITPNPGDKNIFGKLAGYDEQPHVSRSSRVPPNALFASETPEQFPVANLAPRRSTRLPTPPYEDGGDAMDLDPVPPAQTRMPGAPIDRVYRPKSVGLPDATLAVRSPYSYDTIAEQPSGWGALRNETFSIQSQAQQDAERRHIEQDKTTKLRFEPVEQNPFRGRLPQAPMSMERRLRNPPTQVYFRKTPLSEQQDFLGHMRDGIQKGKTFTRTPNGDQQQEDADFEIELPARSRTKGELELRQSMWQLPSDGRDTTGLEDMFGGSFNIEDRPPVENMSASSQHQAIGTGISSRALLTIGIPTFLIVLAILADSIRKPTAMWLLRLLMDAGMLPKDDIMVRATEAETATATDMGGDYVV